MAKTKTKAGAYGLSADDLAILSGQNAMSYAPRVAQIRDLRRQADEQYNSDVESANANSKSTAMHAKASRPDISKIFKTAQDSLSSSQALTSGVIGTAGPNETDPFKAALAREQAARGENLTTAKARELSAIDNEISRAESGRQNAITLAGKTKAKTNSMLDQRLSDILAEKTATDLSFAAQTHKEQLASQAAADKEAAANQKEQDKLAREDKKEHDKHVESVRVASGDFKRQIDKAAKRWDQLLNEGIPVTKLVPKINPKTGQPVEGQYDEIPVVKKDAKGNPVPEMRAATPSEIRSVLAKEGYEPGDIHIALLRRVGKPLDKEAMAYIKTLFAKGVRVPREWMQPKSTLGLPTPDQMDRERAAAAK